MEIEDEEVRFWEFRRKPGPGEYTVKDVKLFLGISDSILQGHLKALGIVVGRYVRNDTYLKKVYAKQYRYLTTDEVRAIIRRARMTQGARILKRQSSSHEM